MKKLFFLLAVVLVNYSAFAQNTTKLLDQYLAVKNALVASDSKAASQAIAAFQQGLTGIEDFAGKDALVKATGTLAKAGNIDKQRAGFNDLSVALWKVVKADEKVEGNVYYQYCPMKKAYWLSKEKDIKNPYYGASMLTCGKVSESR